MQELTFHELRRALDQPRERHWCAVRGAWRSVKRVLVEDAPGDATALRALLDRFGRRQRLIAGCVALETIADDWVDWAIAWVGSDSEAFLMLPTTTSLYVRELLAGRANALARLKAHMQRLYGMAARMERDQWGIANSPAGRAISVLHIAARLADLGVQLARVEAAEAQASAAPVRVTRPDTLVNDVAELVIASASRDGESLALDRWWRRLHAALPIADVTTAELEWA